MRLWDALTGAHVRTLEGHASWVSSVAFSPDVGRLPVGVGGLRWEWDEAVRLWDAVTGAHVRTLEGHTSEVSSVAFSPDGRTLASGVGIIRASVGCGDGCACADTGRAYVWGQERSVQPGWTYACQWEWG